MHLLQSYKSNMHNHDQISQFNFKFSQCFMLDNDNDDDDTDSSINQQEQQPVDILEQEVRKFLILS